MLNDYMDTQSNICNLLKNEIETNHISHAYLIDENDNVEAFEIVMAFVKEILLYNISNEDDRKNLIKRIDDGNYPELKIIEPDGMIIKKQQIINLQQDFSRLAVEGNKRIYIIRDCEKMRSETANSMLKFLEEPESDIVAILMTNNYNNLLSTIISRCQIIRLNKTIRKEDNEFDSLALEFIWNVENTGIDSIIKTQELLFDHISPKERDKMILFFDKVIDMYYKILKMKFNSDNKENNKKMLDISRKNSEKRLLEKIDYLVQAKDSIKFNVNCNLLVDSVIINIGG